MKSLWLAFYLITTLPWLFSTTHAAPFETGEYLGKLGSGTLLMTASKKGQYFKINSFGANGHSCFVEGIIENSISVQKDDSGEDDCLIKFVATAEFIEVTHNEKPACHNFCGTRANYTFPYYKTSPLCHSKIKNKNQKLFKTYYAKKKFDLAEKTLRKVYDACESYMSIFEKLETVNDLAITYKNLKKKDQCLALVKPFEEVADMSEEQLKDNYPPSDAEVILPMMKRLKFNRQLCRNL